MDVMKIEHCIGERLVSVSWSICQDNGRNMHLWHAGDAVVQCADRLITDWPTDCVLGLLGWNTDKSIWSLTYFPLTYPYVVFTMTSRLHHACRKNCTCTCLLYRLTKRSTTLIFPAGHPCAPYRFANFSPTDCPCLPVSPGVTMALVISISWARTNLNLPIIKVHLGSSCICKTRA